MGQSGIGAEDAGALVADVSGEGGGGGGVEGEDIGAMGLGDVEHGAGEVAGS